MSDEEQRAAGQMSVSTETVIGAGEVVVLPHSPKVLRWASADKNPEHRAINVGDDAECSCGWEGSGWTDHLIAVTKSR